MVSLIDPTKPTAGKAFTAHVRNNFSMAKIEIETLQDSLSAIPPVDLSGYLPLSGGVMTGLLTVAGSAGVTSITSSVSALGNANPIVIRPPNGTTNKNGGGVQLIGGSAGPNGGIGGSISLSAGSGSSGGGTPGNIQLTGGFGYNNDGGSIILVPGAVSGATSYGNIELRNLPTVSQSLTTAVWNNNGVLNIGTGSVTVTQQYLDDLHDKLSTITKRIVALESHMQTTRQEHK